jgi:hypothetical protein
MARIYSSPSCSASLEPDPGWLEPGRHVNNPEPITGELNLQRPIGVELSHPDFPRSVIFRTGSGHLRIYPHAHRLTLARSITCDR